MALNLPGMKGGSIPKGPDYGKYEGNAQDLYKTGTSYAGQTMEAAKGLNQGANDTLHSVTGEELPMVKSLNDASNQNLSQYSKIFSPLQEQQANEAKNYTSDSNVAMLRGRAVADTNASLQAGRQNAAMALAAEGVDPASIHGGALDRQDSIRGAAMTSGAANNSYLDTMNTGRALVSQANQLGMQVGAQGTEQAQAGSGIASNLVNSTTGANAGQINNLTAANTYLDTAGSANTEGANIAHTNFSDQLARSHEKDLAAKTQSDSARGWVKTFMEKGGPVPSKGALPYSPKEGSTDTVPMMATPGEFVIPKDVVEHKGNEFFHKLIDSTRLKANERTAIPKPVFAHQSNH